MSALRTPFCRELGIEYPICSVGFGMGAGPELAAAVSNAGGFGVLGTHELTADAIRGRAANTRVLTDRPFGVNVIIADDGSKEDASVVRGGVRAAIAERVAAVVLFWGDPTPDVADAHAHGVKVFIQVGSVAEAQAAVAVGVDAVIVQGVEAGGHIRGTISIWELLPAAVAAVAPVQVLASGDIGDGAGVARALRLGAQGVSLGTRFVASDEAFVHPAHKRRIVESAAEDTSPQRAVRHLVAGCAPPDAAQQDLSGVGSGRVPTARSTARRGDIDRDTPPELREGARVAAIRGRHDPPQL